jgi:hypothetical protein
MPEGGSGCYPSDLQVCGHQSATIHWPCGMGLDPRDRLHEECDGLRLPAS